MLGTKQYMFSYGMNTNLNSMSARCPKAEVIGRAALSNHSFQFKYHADVEEEHGQFVEGVLWAIDLDGLNLMDRCEGYPEYYTREQLWVTCDDGQEYLAWVYKMCGDPELDLPSEAYLRMVHEGYVQNNLDTDQIWQAMDRCYGTNYTSA